MKRLAFVLASATLMAPAMFAQPKQAAAEPKVKVGDTAPDFTLPDTNNKPVKLSDFRGKKNVVLAFFVAAFTAG